MTTAEIKRLFAEYEAEEAKHDKLDEAYENDPENEELEAAWDAQYKVVYSKSEELINAIYSFTAGQIEKKTIHAMLVKYRARLKKIIELAA